VIPVTQKQRKVLNFIEEFVESKRYSPSFQEIADGIGLKSLATVHKHINNLKRKGCLQYAPNVARSVEVTEESAPMSRFEFEGPFRLWDRILQCHWIRESDVKK